MGIKMRWMMAVLTLSAISIALACEDNMNRGYQSQNSNSSASSNRGMNDATRDKQVTDVDNTFIKNASEAGNTEVAVGRLAADRATNSDVKAFASRMVQDHSRANNELSLVVTRLGAGMPTPSDATQKTAIDKLTNLKGAEFDRAFMEQMVTDHQEAVSMFDRYSSSGQNAELKDFASKTLPTLRDHLTSAESISQKLKGTPMPKK